MSEREPKWLNDVPHCQERCPKFDGKRCDELGRQPDTICEPEVRDLQKKLRRIALEAMSADSHVWKSTSGQGIRVMRR